MQPTAASTTRLTSLQNKYARHSAAISHERHESLSSRACRAVPTQFPCGSRGIFAYAQESCCEQGRPFDFTAEYCCTGSGANGLHSYNDGKCDLSCPDNCACYDEVAPFASPVASQTVTIEVPKAGVGMDALVDTSSPPEGGYLCNGKPAGGDQGCMNGYQYNYSTHTPCGSWLMQFGTYGCCPSASGFLPYPMGTLSCCKIEGAPPGQDYQLKPAPCKCHRYGCS